MQFMDAGKVVEALMEVSQRIDALESENMALRAALKPFAEVSELFVDDAPNNYPVKEYLGRFRAAAAALKETGD